MNPFLLSSRHETLRQTIESCSKFSKAFENCLKTNSVGDVSADQLQDFEQRARPLRNVLGEAKSQVQTLILDITVFVDATRSKTSRYSSTSGAANDLDILLGRLKSARYLAERCDYLSNGLYALNEQSLRLRTLSLLTQGNENAARVLYEGQCAGWWPRPVFEKTVCEVLAARETRVKEEQAREARRMQEALRTNVVRLLEEAEFDAANAAYFSQCTDWWPQDDYARMREHAEYRQEFIRVYAAGGFGALDSLFLRRPASLDLSIDDFISLKLPQLRHLLSDIDFLLDEEQEFAIAHPAPRLLIQARAGSGKTRTLCALAVLAVRDAALIPSQVMVLAFNKAAAKEIETRIRSLGGIANFENARTFHSLAYQIAKPMGDLLFDSGGEPSNRSQGRFVQRVIHRILNPAFKEAMVEFFRRELEQIEGIGRDLEPSEYFQFRRSFELFTLRGEKVKSNGEKFIADFLFEHGIEYKYERAWAWKVDFLAGSVYRPDFSFVYNGRDYILEHWAIDPASANPNLPTDWDLSASEYRQQISDKRLFWRTKRILLLETHVGMMRDGRTSFECILKAVFERAGIHSQRLTKGEIIRRVFENDVTISRMTDLFQQFIQRAKKKGWTPDETAKRIESHPDAEPRTRLFHELALRAYREYQQVLSEQKALDFDDLLAHATDEVLSRGPSASIHLGRGLRISIAELKWILIDEFQDFSEPYFRLINAILDTNRTIRLVAVGDNWQAINGFAGAELRYFEKFSEYFSQTGKAVVTTNYRSAQSIVAVGNALMRDQGEPATPNNRSSGTVELLYLEDIWIEFRQEVQHKSQRDSDAIYLPKDSVARGPSFLARRQAQALKTIATVIQESPEEETLILARTSTVYGIYLAEFASRLIEALSILLNESITSLEKRISAQTAHSSKGQEASRVVVLDVTRRQFPKIHPDNLLFGIFDVSPKSVLAEERRLFYVAITRARHSLYLMTEKGEESPFIQVLDLNSPPSFRRAHGPGQARRSDSLGEFARKVRASIDSQGLSWQGLT